MTIRFGEKSIRTLKELDLGGKSVFCRLDLNVPTKGEEIKDDTRIRAALPTIEYLLGQGAKVVLASHLGRPKGKVDPKYTLLPVAQHLAKVLDREVIFPDDCIGSGVKKILRDRKQDDLVLLENLRFHSEEEKNDASFAKELKGETDVFVSDAFGTMHRAHASTHALPLMYSERGVGFLVEKEMKFLAPLLENPGHPYALVLGGAKVSDKIKVIESFLRRVDDLFLGGAMVFTFLKAMGHKVGKSLVEEDRLVQAKRILDEASAKGVRVHLPKDFLLGNSVEEPGNMEICEGLGIPDGKMGLDIGPKTVEEYAQTLKVMKTVFWNGPMGLFEKPPFDQGTMGIAKMLSEMSSTRVIGGGDSAAAVTKAGLEARMSHISTGGGASLEFLEGKALPGLESLAV